MIDDLHYPVAAHFAKLSWEGIGPLLGHGLLFYGAQKLATHNWPPYQPEHPLWVNFWAKLKKAVLFSGLEIASRPMHEPFFSYWQKLTPAAQGFLAPFIEKVVTPALKALQKHGIAQIKPPTLKMQAQQMLFKGYRAFWRWWYPPLPS